MSSLRFTGMLFCAVLSLAACENMIFDGAIGPAPGMEPNAEEDISLNRPQATTPQVTTPQPASANRNIFGRSLKSDSERLNRLERAVQNLRDDFDSVQPSIRRLTALENDITDLIGELRRLSAAPPSLSTPAAPAPYVAPPVAAQSQETVVPVRPAATTRAPTSYQQESAPPVQNGGATIFDVRSGEHPGRTRLVLDSNNSVQPRVDIDNSERIMTIELPGTTWSAARSKNFPKSSIVQGYTVQETGNGILMIVQLARAGRLTMNTSLPGNGAQGRRLVFDIAPQ